MVAHVGAAHRATPFGRGRGRKPHVGEGAAEGRHVVEELLPARFGLRVPVEALQHDGLALLGHLGTHAESEKGEKEKKLFHRVKETIGGENCPAHACHSTKAEAAPPLRP